MKKHYLILVMGLVLALSIPAWATMTHRYDFTTDANDLVAGLESTLVGDAYVSDGSLVLDGTDDWLEMDAAGIDANSYTALTMEMWYTPVDGGNDSWSMLAFLGGNNPDTTWMGVHYMFMTSARDDDFSRAAICTNNTTDPWATETGVNGTEYDDGVKHHMVAAVDDTQITFFIDGELVGTAPLSVNNNLASVSNELAFLGKGGYMNDPEWNGTIQEFRIYDKVLNQGEVITNRFFGEDSLQDFVMLSMSPEYGAMVDKELNVELAWTLDTNVLASVDSYDLYVGTDPNIADPNKSDISGYSAYTQTGLTVSSHSVPDASLEFDTTYYWRVVANSGAETYPSVGMSFTTYPDAPSFIEQPDDLVIADSSDSITLSVVTARADNWKWYKSTEPGTTLSNTETLNLSGVSASDEDNYLCDAWHSDNENNVVTSKPARVIARRMMGHWTFDDGSYDDIIDEEISGAIAHDAVLTVNTDVGGPGDPNFASEIGETAPQGADAAWFYNDGDYLEVPDSDFFNYYHEGLTVSCWVKDTGTNWNHPVIKLEAGNGDVSGYLFGLDSDYRTDCRFVFENVLGWPGLNSDDGPDPDVEFTDGNWHMMTATYDVATGTAYMFADGRLVDSASVDFSDFGYPDAPLMLGGSNLDGNHSISGGLDDVRVYSYPLSATDVALLYTDLAGGYVCVEDSENPLTYDANGDCRVTLDDLADLFQLWLECDRIPVTACN